MAKNDIMILVIKVNDSLRQWHIECSEHNRKMREDKEYREAFLKSYDNDGNNEDDYEALMVMDDKNRKGYFLNILEEEPNYFEELVKIIGYEYNKKHSKGGRKPKLTIADMLTATIEYFDKNVPYLNIAKKYGVHESNIYETIKWVEQILLNNDVIFKITVMSNIPDYYVLDIEKIDSIKLK